MRIIRRFIRTVFPAAAAAAVIAAAVPASAAAHHAALAGAGPVGTNASCGATAITPTRDTVGVPGDCAQVGYQASGRDFRYIAAITRVPNHNGNPAADGWQYVALDSSTGTTFQYARVGVAPCGGCTASGWVAFISVQDPSLTSPVNFAFPIATAGEGAGVFVSVYLTANDNALLFTVRLPSGTKYTRTVGVTSPTYLKAQALADYAPAEVASGTSQPKPLNRRVTQFLQGRVTTLSGVTAGFAGPWTLRQVKATSNGHLPPKGTVIGYPGTLYTDGLGKPSDAFGVWLF